MTFMLLLTHHHILFCSLKCFPVTPLIPHILCSLSGSTFTLHLWTFPKVNLVLGFFLFMWVVTGSPFSYKIVNDHKPDTGIPARDIQGKRCSPLSESTGIDSILRIIIPRDCFCEGKGYLQEKYFTRNKTNH